MIGQSIGGYRIVAKLGEGGMGVVYLGEHQRITRSAAIKVLLPEYSAVPDVLSRFFNEARATSAIQHPGIVEIFDCDVLPDGSAYIVMEQLKGESLGGLLRRSERFNVHRAAVVARHIADALSAAHDKQIVHRDLKPDNVFVLESGAQPTKILDFGIAKLMDRRASDGHHVTRTGILLGTPLYMSPEQCRGASDIDYRTDIYSLGLILFEMIAGRPPVTGTGFGEIIQSHVVVVPPRLRTIDAAVPEALDDLVARLLAKAPGDRPQSMRAVTKELDQIIAAAPAGAAEVAAPVRSTTAPGGAPRQVRTMVMPQNQAVNTTLGSASSERMEAVVDDEDDAPAPTATRRRGPIVAIASAAAVVGIFGIWLVARPHAPPPDEAGEPRRPRAAVEVEVPSPAATAPAEVPAKPAPARVEAPAEKPEPPPAPRRPVAEKVKVAAPSEPPPSPPKAHGGGDKIKVVITSVPSGADVCYAKDLALIGKTRLEWHTGKSATPTKLLVRMPGYRGQEISVADHEIKTTIKLHALGPDDPADVDNCARAR